MKKTTDSATPRMWGLHSSEYPKLPIDRKCVAIGWDRLGDLAKLPRDREAFKMAYAEAYKDERPTEGHVNTNATQLLAFAWDAKPGDYVAYLEPNSKNVYVGRITGDYRFDTECAERYRNVRDAEWRGPFARDSFMPATLSALGCCMTFWKVAKGEMTAVTRDLLTHGGYCGLKPSEKSHDEWVYENLYTQLDGEGFERFVADLFRVYGYEVKTTARSGDHGIDLVATRTDALYSQTAYVQVKRRKEAVGEDRISALCGTIAAKHGSRGVFVSYGGFQNAALVSATEKGIAVIDGRRVCTLALWNEERLAKDWPQVFAHGA